MDAHNRKIVHIDMDAFYASVEQRDNPDLRGKPIAVGGGANRGVTTTASYEARKFGVKSAMPGYAASQLCPQLIFVPPRFDVYREVSAQVRSIFLEYTDLIEPLSLDEAFLDVTTNKKDLIFGMEVAKEIMHKVETQVGITCSAGVSYCKFLAKIASDFRKPNGLTVIRPDQAEEFIGKLPIKDFFGVGKVTASKMRRLGIETGADIKKYSKIELAQHFGKSGRFFYDIVRGIDDRAVQSNRVRKSIGIETTFESDVANYDELENALVKLVDKFFERLVKADNFGRTLTLKLKTSDFQILTRSKSEEFFIKDKDMILKMVFELLENNKDHFDKIRLIGVTSSNLEKEILDQKNRQLSFEW